MCSFVTVLVVRVTGHPPTLVINAPVCTFAEGYALVGTSMIAFAPDYASIEAAAMPDNGT